jgi:hypothetical protein
MAGNTILAKTLRDSYGIFEATTLGILTVRIFRTSSPAK